MRVAPRRLLRGAGELHLRNGGIVSDLLEEFPVPVGEVVETPDFAVFDEIAEHDDAGDLVVPEHALEIGLSSFEGGLGDEYCGVGGECDCISVDVGGVLFFAEDDPAVLVWIVGALQMDC